MDDCIIISSDEEDQVPKKPPVPNTSSTSREDKDCSTKSAKTLKEVPKEAQPSTSGSADKSRNGITDPSKAFEEFVAICKRDQDPDMETILEKMRKYHKNANPEYTESREFMSFLSKKGSDVLRDPRNIFIFIKEVVDELRQRKSKRIEDDTGPPSKKQKDSHTEQDYDEAHKAQRIKLLSKAMEKIQRRIQKLEEREVDFDEENDSAYIQLERYKERVVKIYEKICELSGEQKIGQIHRRKIAFSGTNSAEINKCIEKFINKTGQFPDFHDILKLIKSVESEKNKTPEQIRQLAIEAFEKAGEQLQLHRRYESWRALSVFLKDESDPAETNPELQEQLKKNYDQYAKRIPEVIDQFAEKQVTEKLVPEEVPDEEAEQSEGKEEDGDEEEEDEEEEEELIDENETEFMEKVLSGEMSDDDSEEEDRAKNIISLENLEHMNFNGRFDCSGSVSPPVLGENLNERMTTYAEESNEPSDPIVVVMDKSKPNADNSCENLEPIVIE